MKLGHSDGVGASLLRKEDDRLLRGKGHYIGDISLDGTREVAFVRSSVAHARLLGVQIPKALRSSVFTAEDLTGVKPIRAVSPLPGFKASEQPPLVTDKIRHVGELIAMCMADTRAEAEDIAAQVMVDYDVLPAVVDMLDAQSFDAPRVHDSWNDNIYLEDDALSKVVNIDQLLKNLHLQILNHPLLVKLHLLPHQDQPLVQI